MNFHQPLVGHGQLQIIAHTTANCAGYIGKTLNRIFLVENLGIRIIITSAIHSQNFEPISNWNEQVLWFSGMWIR